MHELTQMIKKDMVPALGVTEPGAIAFSVAKARSCMEYALNNMASSITGMICDGGNQGCTMKGMAACDAAFKSAEFAMNGVHVDRAHGINGATPEETMRNMGRIASPGMVGTEKTILEIFEGKQK